MNGIFILTGLLSLGLLVYLFISFIKREYRCGIF